MRTTVRLNDSLLEKAKRVAAERHTTLTSLIEQGLQYVVASKPAVSKKKQIKLPSFKSGVREGVDLSNNALVRDILDGLR